MTNPIIERIVGGIQLLLSDNILRRFATRLTSKNYNQGLDEFDKEFTPRINVTPNQQAIDFLSTFTFENLKGVREDLGIKLRQEFVAAFTNQESQKEIADRVQKVMNISRTRAEAIARTESNRAFNAGGAQAAAQSGLELRKEVFNPDPQATICKALVKRKPIDTDKTWSFQGEEHRLPPFHVHCRSRAIYRQITRGEVSG